MTAVAVNMAAGDEWDVLVDRSTKWGNPYSHKPGTRAHLVVPTRTEALRRYCSYLLNRRLDLYEAAKAELRGKRLACTCLPMPCHAEILAEIANGEPEEGVDFMRAGGQCDCLMCGEKYIDHRPYMGSLTVASYGRIEPWGLHVLCDGKIIKT